MYLYTDILHDISLINQQIIKIFHGIKIQKMYNYFKVKEPKRSIDNTSMVYWYGGIMFENKIV